MKALIDADIFQYEFGSCTDSEYKPLAWPLVQARIQGRINGILEATKADSYQLYLTSDDKSNFRYKTSTIKPYKGHRAEEKPYWYNHIRNFLIDYREAQEVSGHEADDAISIAAWEAYRKVEKKIESNAACGQPFLSSTPISSYCNDVVICSRDKDLNMVPGWHYSWGTSLQKEKPFWFQTELGGLKCFYKQLLTGDPVDNILGLFGVGKSSTLLKHIDSCETEEDMYSFCLNQYEKRFGSYAHQFILENGRLLWMLRHKEEMWNGPE